MIIIGAALLFLIALFYACGEMFFERSLPKRTWKGLLLAFLVLIVCFSAQAQNNVRWDLPVYTVQASGGNLLPVYAIPGASVSFYTCSGATCTTLANTYYSASDATACPTTTQVVLNGAAASPTSCVANADPWGNMGGWFQPGQYMATITGQGKSYNYYFTIGSPGSSVGSAQGTYPIEVNGKSSVPATGNITVSCATGQCGASSLGNLINAPSTGQYVILPPTGFTPVNSTASCPSTPQGYVIPDTTGTNTSMFAQAGPCGNNVNPDTWGGTFSWTGALESVGLTQSQVTAVYSAEIVSSSAFSGGGIPNQNQLDSACQSDTYFYTLTSGQELEADTGFVNFVAQQATTGNMGTGTGVDSLTCTSKVTHQVANDGGAITMTISSPVMIVYYTGTPVTNSTPSINFAAPLYWNSALNVVGLQIPFNYGLDSGSANAYQVSIPTLLAPGQTQYVPAVGTQIVITPANTNTSSSTLTLNGNGPTSITKAQGGSQINLVAGDLVAGVEANLLFNGTAWQLTNPQTGIGITWPSSADIVLSNGTDSPAGLAPVNGDCVIGSGGAWTAGSCTSSSNGAQWWLALQTASSNTALNKMACWANTSNDSNYAVLCPTTLADGGTDKNPAYIGIGIADMGTSGFGEFQYQGQVNWTCDNQTDVGDWVGISSSSAGECHDAAITEQQLNENPEGNGAMGVVLVANTGAGTTSLVEIMPHYGYVNQTNGGANAYGQAFALCFTGSPFCSTSYWTQMPSTASGSSGDAFALAGPAWDSWYEGTAFARTLPNGGSGYSTHDYLIDPLTYGYGSPATEMVEFKGSQYQVPYVISSASGNISIGISGHFCVGASTGTYIFTLSGNATLEPAECDNAGHVLTFEIIQAATGGPYTWTWPANFENAPTISATASAVTTAQFFYDGTDYYYLGSSSGVTWPTSADLVLSNATDSPAGLAPVNGDCVVGSGGAWTAGSCSSGSGLNGTVTYTSSQTASTSDNGKLVVMNCSSSCSYTLPATQPSTTWLAWVQTVGSSVATIVLGGSDTFNGSSSVPVLNSYRALPIWANTATSTDYRGEVPLVASTNVTLTPASNGLSISASGGGGSGAWTNITGSGQITASGCTQSASSGGYCAISGSSTTVVTLSGIPTSYNALHIWIYGAATSGNTVNIQTTFNSDTSAHYAINGSYQNSTNNPASAGQVSQDACYLGVLGSGTASSNTIDIPGYADTSFGKTAVVQVVDMASISSTTNNQYASYGCGWSGTAAITSITFTIASNDYAANTKFIVYGVN